jgi:hypothetical protein
MLQVIVRAPESQTPPFEIDGTVGVSPAGTWSTSCRSWAIETRVPVRFCAVTV